MRHTPDTFASATATYTAAAFDAAVETAFVTVTTGNLDRFPWWAACGLHAPAAAPPAPIVRRLSPKEERAARRATVRALRLRARTAEAAGDYARADALRAWASELSRPPRRDPDYAFGGG